MQQRLTPSLILALTFRHLQEQTQNSFLGWVWLIIGPLVQLGIYTVVFGVIFNRSFGVVDGETTWHYALGVFIGMMLVQTITEPMGIAPGLLTSQSNLVKKNALPLIVIPLAHTISSFLKLSLTLAAWSIGVIILQPSEAYVLLLLPVLILPLFLIALGMNAGISAVSVYVGDFGQAIRMLSQIVFWSSGVFYSRSEVEAYPQIWAFMRWNPLLHVIEESRRVLLWGVSLDFGFYIFSLIFGIVLCFVGVVVFGWLKRGFADFV
jgi:lipopolysaccharide transport system permease protein|tara:strand:+ start:328 stop:1119 length:792 start_codon:yes stop_codon:yes gene_type:complete